MKTPTAYLILALSLFMTINVFSQKTIQADKILEDIKNGKNISFENVTIEGVLDLTYRNDKIGDLPKKWFGNQDQKIEEDIEGSVSFINCDFSDDVLAYISDDDSDYTFVANFEKDVMFKNCRFKRNAMFKYSEFDEDAIFEGTKFEKESTFKYAKFRADATFKNTYFEREATFKYALFETSANFVDATFDDDAIFKYTQFEVPVSFDNAVFEDDAVFKYTKFDEGVSFNNVEFGSLDIKYVKVRGDFSTKNMKVRGDIDAKYSDINGRKFRY